MSDWTHHSDPRPDPEGAGEIHCVTKATVHWRTNDELAPELPFLIRAGSNTCGFHIKKGIKTS